MEWYHDHEMQERINMFSAHGIDVRDVRKMGTVFYRDYIMKKKRSEYKEESIDDVKKFKGDFDNILKFKRRSV